MIPRNTPRDTPRNIDHRVWFYEFDTEYGILPARTMTTQAAKRRGQMLADTHKTAVTVRRVWVDERSRRRMNTLAVYRPKL